MINEAVNYILDIPKFAAKTSLDNTRNMLNRIGDYGGIKIIHVAGTNGKGSVCAYISTVLTEMNIKTGLFTSPHLVKMNERIKINNRMISDEKFYEAYKVMRRISGDMVREGFAHPSFFEFLFGMAMHIFIEEKVEYLVLETGLGGRLDATNAIEKPMLSVITSISLDHMYILGDTIEKIAAEKAGIIKKDVPVVFWGENREVYDVISRRAKETGADFLCLTKNDIRNIEIKDKFIDFCVVNKYYNNVDFSVHSLAVYQTENAALAACAMAVLARFDKRITTESVKNGIRDTFWEGRMEEILPGVFLDGAHNEDGIRAFLESIKARPDSSKKYLMFAAVSDKSFGKMIELICKEDLFDEYIVSMVDNEKRAEKPEVFADIFSAYTNKPVTVIADDEEAFSLLMKKKGENGSAYIAGSLYLVGKIKTITERGNYDKF